MLVDMLHESATVVFEELNGAFTILLCLAKGHAEIYSTCACVSLCSENCCRLGHDPSGQSAVVYYRVNKIIIFLGMVLTAGGVPGFYTRIYGRRNKDWEC